MKFNVTFLIFFMSINPGVQGCAADEHPPVDMYRRVFPRNARTDEPLLSHNLSRHETAQLERIESRGYTQQQRVALDRLNSEISRSDDWQSRKNRVKDAIGSHALHPDDIQSQVLLIDALAHADDQFLHYLLHHKADPNVRHLFTGKQNLLFLASTVPPAQLLLAYKANVHCSDDVHLNHDSLYHTLSSEHDPRLVLVYFAAGLNPRSKFPIPDPLKCMTQVGLDLGREISPEAAGWLVKVGGQLKGTDILQTLKAKAGLSCFSEEQRYLLLSAHAAMVAAEKEVDETERVYPLWLAELRAQLQGRIPHGVQQIVVGYAEENPLL
ncbi:MAG TPA: hypothetical protein VLH77_03560, partial [Gammaproteobacteria bacterium]|nr:hypothetical protein [Gammaproteobacteria bacterium]